jgi:hypothetical protein
MSLSRILVIVLAAGGIGLFIWSLGVYTQRINWVSQNKKEDPGVFDRQADKIQEYQKGVDTSFRRWSGNLQTVNFLESQRYPRRAFYAGQLNLVRSSSPVANGQPVPNPVQNLVIDPNTGYLDISKPVGRPPIMVSASEPADSILGYQRKTAQVIKDISASQQQNQKALADRDIVNKEIVGIKEPMLVKGLRQLINEQKQIEDEANVEDGYVSRNVTNREAEFGLLKKRRDALSARTVELRSEPR